MVRQLGITASLLTSIPRTARCGPACRVVWQGTACEGRPYADPGRTTPPRRSPVGAVECNEAAIFPQTPESQAKDQKIKRSQPSPAPTGLGRICASARSNPVAAWPACTTRNRPWPTSPHCPPRPTSARWAPRWRQDPTHAAAQRRLSSVPGTGEQHCRCRRLQQALGHASIALLLHGQHRRHLRLWQQTAVGFTDLPQQLVLHSSGIGASAHQARRLSIETLDLGGVQIGGQQRIALRQGKLDDGAIQAPIPARRPVQCTGQVLWQGG